MHVICALEQLLHVELDVTRLELDSLVFKEAGEVVVHVGKDHVDR
jgi:hypothetical protein